MAEKVDKSSRVLIKFGETPKPVGAVSNRHRLP